MAEQSRTWMVAVGVLVVVLAGIGFLLWKSHEAKPAPVVPSPVAVTPSPVATARPAETQLPEGVTLNTSDAFVRQVVSTLSSNPALVKWLANKDLVRRFVASVNLVAQGKSPRKLLPFARPHGRFRVVRRGGELVASPRSYHRYDLVADIFTSLDTKGAVEALHELRPLIDQAYREIGRPGTTFDEVLERAIVELLETPVLPAAVPLKVKVVTYTYVDPRLEALSDAQRLLLRMGPDNVRRIQAKLREFAAPLGIPPDRLPAPTAAKKAG